LEGDEKEASCCPVEEAGVDKQFRLVGNPLVTVEESSKDF